MYKFLILFLAFTTLLFAETPGTVKYIPVGPAKIPIKCITPTIYLLGFSPSNLPTDPAKGISKGRKEYAEHLWNSYGEEAIKKFNDMCATQGFTIASLSASTIYINRDRGAYDPIVGYLIVIKKSDKDSQQLTVESW
jgi:hypothetical protein